LFLKKQEKILSSNLGNLLYQQKLFTGFTVLEFHLKLYKINSVLDIVGKIFVFLKNVK